MPRKPVKKGKKSKKNKKTSKKYTKYKIEGDKITRERFCPRCGPGIFLMQAKDRVYCGKCKYSEFHGKPKEVSEEPKAEAKASEKSESKEEKKE